MQPAQTTTEPKQAPSLKRAALRWHHDDTAQCEAANAETVQQLQALVKDGHKSKVLKLLDGWPAADVVSCFARMKTKQAQKLLSWFSDDTSLKVLAELDERTHGVLFEEASKAKLRKLLNRYGTDKALRMLKRLPDDVVEDLINGHPDEAVLRHAMENEHTAAGEMRRGALAILEDWTIDDVINDIRTRSGKIEKLDSLHVVDNEGFLTGYMRIRDLLLHPRETRVGDVQRRDPLAVSGETDQEEVLRLAKKRKEGVIAVVDGEGRLIGAITPRELFEIAREEAEEDMLLMGGVSAESTEFDGPLTIVRRRIPWLIGGLAGAMIAASVIGSFEHVLTQAAILASFIPVVMATAGNAGMQASTVSIQALGSGASLSNGFLPRLMREMAGALLNGLLLGTAVFALVLIASQFLTVANPLMLGVTVSLALVGVILFAGTVGTVVPFVLKALKLDPAVATGIFILTANDVFGVLILFAVATQLYL